MFAEGEREGPREGVGIMTEEGEKRREVVYTDRGRQGGGSGVLVW